MATRRFDHGERSQHRATAATPSARVAREAAAAGDTAPRTRGSRAAGTQEARTPSLGDEEETLMARAPLVSTSVDGDGAPRLTVAPDRAQRSTITVARVDLWSVARVAIMFWSCIGAMLIGAFIVLWGILASAGAVSNFEHFVADVTGVKQFHVMSNTVLGAIALIVLLAMLVSIAMTVLAAACYNALTSLMGGITVECRED
jgi:hypothetical protein